MPDARELYVTLGETFDKLLPAQLAKHTTIKPSYNTPICEMRLDRVTGGWCLHYNPTAECWQDPRMLESIVRHECTDLIHLSVRDVEPTRRERARRDMLAELRERVRRYSGWCGSNTAEATKEASQ